MQFVKKENKPMSGDSGFPVRRDYANYLSNNSTCLPSAQFYP